MDALKMKYEEMKNDMVDLKSDAADIEKIRAIYQREHDAFIDHLAHNKNKDVIEHVTVYRECLKAFDALKRPNDKEALALFSRICHRYGLYRFFTCPSLTPRNKGED